MFQRQVLSFVRSYSRYAKNDQIYLHEVAGKYAASFSASPKALPIGISPSLNVTPETFQPNPKFVELLHNTVKDKIQDDFTFIMEAGANASTFMPIYDFREVPRYARTPEVDNVFGYVLVGQDGKIVPGSYESNGLYRVCNGVGLPKLSDFLLEEIRKGSEA